MDTIKKFRSFKTSSPVQIASSPRHDGRVFGEVIKGIGFAALMLCASMAIAQEFAIKQVELGADGVAIYYDLNDTTKSRFYSIHVFTSRDNFLNPLLKVKGDAGLEVKAGLNRKIVWDTKEYGPTFRGDVEIEIRGKVYVPFVRFSNAYKSIKRGKSTPLTWTGGTRQNILNFSLYNSNDELMTVIPNVANSGNYDMVIPKSVKPGSGYYFIVGDSKNKDQMMKTSVFAVKRKVKLVYKILPALLVGGAIYYFLPDSGPEVLDGPGDPPVGKN